MKKVRYVYFLTFLGVYVFFQCKAQPHEYSSGPTLEEQLPDCVFDPVDTVIFRQTLSKLRKLPTLSARNAAVAQSFMKTPYIHGTLERPDSEQLVINLRELDCWTYVENSLALALTSMSEEPSFALFAEKVRQLRYHNGQVKGYGSRRHYFLDWVKNAIDAGYLRDMTADFGGVPLQKNINYMSTHPAAYPGLRQDSALLQVRRREQELSQIPWLYIPKQHVARIEDYIKDGDLLVFISSKKNLDVEHQGFALWGNDGVLRVMHASSTFHRVVVSPRPLSNYLMRLPAMAGIIVLRIRND